MIDSQAEGEDGQKLKGLYGETGITLAVGYLHTGKGACKPERDTACSPSLQGEPVPFVSLSLSVVAYVCITAEHLHGFEGIYHFVDSTHNLTTRRI